jgi:serine protease Do
VIGRLRTTTGPGSRRAVRAIMGEELVALSSRRIQQPVSSTLILPGAPDGSGSVVPVLVHLSGSRRGTSQRLAGDNLRIGTAPDAEVRVSPEPSVAPHHATLRRTAGGTFELVSEADSPVWVNGDPVRRRALAPGDVLEIGRDGPLLRFRVYPPGTRASKSVAEAFADGVDGARYTKRSGAARAALGAAGAVRELAVRAPLWFRLAVTLSLAALVASSFWLLRQSRRLEDRLALETRRVEGLSVLLDEAAPQLTGAELAVIRRELATALQRVEALEARSGAPARIVAAAAPAVALLQGSYGFNDPASGEMLRFLGLGADGRPLRDDTGEPIVGFGGEGPPVEIYFTGTAFLVGRDGTLLTNRHLVVPWRYDPAAQRALTHGLEPAMRRFVAYLPGSARSSPVRPLQISETADLATLLAPELAGRASPLRLRRAPPAAGEEILVLGYPAGMRAMVARADARFVDELMQRGQLGFWQIAEQLARSGQIGPLASRGIVAQVNPAAVAYDAETTQGGSGGPVLDLDGEVIAVTSAVVTEFGGSNLGVPAAYGSRLLAEGAMRRLLASRWR